MHMVVFILTISWCYAIVGSIVLKTRLIYY